MLDPYALVRPALFRLDPEQAHELALSGLALAAPAMAHAPGPPDGAGRLAQELLGLRFANPVGLAAGFDKRARAVPAWPALGFGFAEVGTVTLHAQPGNPRPRLFRLPDDRALINRLGFNNDGAAATAATLRRWRALGALGRAPLGVNLGKSKRTPAEQAPEDYAGSVRLLGPYADYLTINVSSPNTPGLRDLQAAGTLGAILDAVDLAAREGAADGAGPPPLLVKIAPDLDDAQVDAVTDLALARGLAGMVVANTTVGREGLASPARLQAEQGGLSGRPLHARATALVRRVADRAGGRLVIVGVGGIFDADDAWAMLAAGASLVQLYTGFVYGGPLTPRTIAAGLLRRMDREGLGHISELVGGDRRASG